MFKDLPEGQTHSFNDGCGEPAHNMTVKTYKKRIENKEIECACDEKGKCGKHYFSCEFCQQDRRECRCD